MSYVPVMAIQPVRVSSVEQIKICWFLVPTVNKYMEVTSHFGSPYSSKYLLLCSTDGRIVIYWWTKPFFFMFYHNKKCRILILPIGDPRGFIITTSVSWCLMGVLDSAGQSYTEYCLCESEMGLTLLKITSDHLRLFQITSDCFRFPVI